MIREWLISRAVDLEPGMVRPGWIGVARLACGRVQFYVYYWRYGDDIYMDKRHWFRDILVIQLEKGDD